MAMNGTLWVTNHGGKMTGIDSISTSCADNPNCIRRRQNGDSVCSKCYASKYIKMRKTLKERLTENSDILSKKLLTIRETPVINAQIFRLESFGDLYNSTHLKNYINICNNNPFTTFALWTKNLWILNEVFNKEGITKPDNLIIVLSSPLLNQQMEIDREEYWFIDHVFTVYDKQFIKENNININCGASKCLGCQVCYHKHTDFYVNEKLK